MNSIIRRTKSLAVIMMSAMILFTATVSVFAGNEKKNSVKANRTELWRQIEESRVQLRGERSRLPEKYQVFQLNQSSLRNSLADLPVQNSDAARTNPLVVEVPMPDGSIQKFRMERTAVLSPELAAQYTDWRTFTGYGVDDTTAIGQFDWNAMGFHGYIETGKGIVYIDPYQKGDTQNYLVFYKHEFGKPLEDFSETVNDNMSNIAKSDYQFFAPEFSFGASLRTYRIAIAATGEWSRNAAGTGATTPQQIRDGALAVIVTSVNRLNGIYIRELASQFQLVNPPTNNNATNIVFDDPATDPYNNTDQADDTMGNVNQLRVNQETLNNRVGNANFDIGHLYGTGGGGVATSPSLCDDGDKGQGYSARGTQTGDPFTVDYVAHEIGHQFGSNHTYNNIDTPGTGACPQSSYSAMNAYEPGSGSTIMSYVGICGARNLQQNVDFAIPAFHIRSLTVINTYVATTSCGTVSGTNSIPTVNAGAAYTIPRLTPFTLTATGADTDSGDVSNLLYSWEEYDLAQAPSGPRGTPPGTYDVDSDGVLRPLFRVYSPVASASRTFPSQTFILNPANNDPAGSNQPPLTYTGTHPTNAPGAVCEEGVTCVVGERLPTVNRTMNFRVSLRDRRGGVADAGTSVTVNAAAGPFVVNSQNTATAWTGNSVQTITWDVAGTNVAPINATNVNILLSTDGGQTFPIRLSQNTPNDGSEALTIPNISTTTARIKIEAVGNIFFDINNVNFTINASTTATRTLFDFDGDGRTDVSVFRPSTGDWFINRSSAGFNAVRFGTSTDLITPADFDGDGKTDIGVFRPSEGTWYRLNSQNNTFTGVRFGQNGDLPRPADFDGDGKADINVFRSSNGTWYRLNSTDGQFVANQFGQSGDFPVPADYNGDGKDDLAVFRPSANAWYIARATGVPAQSFDSVNFGTTGDIPVPANYDGDSKVDVAVFRPSNGVWYRINSSTGQFFAVQFGQNGDVPVPGDYDGDRKSDITVFRPSTGSWYSMNSQSGSPFITFGASSDKPVPAAFSNQ